MAGTIGIKIANGDFYPVIEENSTLRKRLILTTVHDRQESVQIDFFRSISKSMLDAQYIGSLMVENVRPKPQGEASIEVIIGSDMDGNITADASDLDIGGEHQTLNVSLGTMSSIAQRDGFPDFDLDIKDPQTPSGLYSRTRNNNEEVRKFPWLIMGLASVFVVLVIVLLWLFFLDGIRVFQPNERITMPGRVESPLPPSVHLQQETEPRSSITQPQIPPQTTTQLNEPPPQIPPPQIPPQSQPVTSPPVIQAPTSPPPARPQTAQRVRPPAPVSSYRVPTVIPRNGVVYQIQWGDTLWDISAAFYRNPWLYPRIARYNNIRNPDHIISGFNVRIPPLN